MSGKKPSGFAIVRGFRGQMLYLASVHAGNGFRWVSEKNEALVFADVAEASRVSERASREYGAKTTVVDMHDAAHVVTRGSNKVAAANCRALLAQLTINGRVDHKAFLAEMDTRAAAAGTALTAEQYGLLGRIAAAYENELAVPNGNRKQPDQGRVRKGALRAYAVLCRKRGTDQ